MISVAHSTAPNLASLPPPPPPPPPPGETYPSTPFPATTRKFETITSGTSGPCAEAVSITARAMGCVAPRSSAATIASAVKFPPGLASIVVVVVVVVVAVAALVDASEEDLKPLRSNASRTLPPRAAAAATASTSSPRARGVPPAPDPLLP